MPIHCLEHLIDDGIQRLPQGRVERPALFHSTMKPRTRDILYRAIEEGVRRGMEQAHKHIDAPPTQWIEGCIEDAIWLEIDAVFNFDDEPA